MFRSSDMNHTPSWDYETCLRHIDKESGEDTLLPNCVVKIENTNIFWGSHSELKLSRYAPYKKSTVNTLIEWCEQNNITTIINAAPGEPKEKPIIKKGRLGNNLKGSKIKLYELDIRNLRDKKVKLFETLDDCGEIANESHKNNENILVVCQAGQDRSQLIIGSILIYMNITNSNILSEIEEVMNSDIRPGSKGYYNSKNRKFFEDYFKYRLEKKINEERKRNIVILDENVYFKILTGLHHEVLDAMERFGIVSDRVDIKQKAMDDFKLKFTYHSQ